MNTVNFATSAYFIRIFSPFVLGFTCYLLYASIQTALQKGKCSIGAFDFLFTLFAGISYITMMLITSDGVFRLYMLILFTFGAFVARIAFKKAITALIDKIATILTKIIKRFVSLLISMVKIILKLLKKGKSGSKINLTTV